MERFSLGLFVPKFLLVGQAGLIGCFGMMIVGVVGLIHGSDLPVNPFAEYADVFPGQPSSAIDTNGFTCIERDYSAIRELAEMYCRKSLDTGTFANVEAVYSKGLIKRTTFALRDNALTLGDLAVLLNLSEMQFSGHVLFNWSRRFGYALVVSHSARLTMFSHVWQVTLTNTPVDQ